MPSCNLLAYDLGQCNLGCTVQYCTVQYCTVLYCTVLYSTVLWLGALCIIVPSTHISSSVSGERTLFVLVKIELKLRPNLKYLGITSLKNEVRCGKTVTSYRVFNMHGYFWRDKNVKNIQFFTSLLGYQKLKFLKKFNCF